MLRTGLFLLLFLPLAAPANEAQIRKTLESKLGDSKIERVQPGPMPGLWEVHVRTARGMRVLYTDATASHVIDGRIIDVRTDRDLTDERQRQLNAIKFETLPLHQAVKVQRGDGRRTLVMFSDPYCPYCVKFEKTLQQINDITVYVFMYPVIRPQNADHSKAVWCSPDRAKAWLELALHHKRPAASADCDNPVEKNIELGHALGVEGTPTLVLVNGERVSAGLAAPDLAAALDKAAKSAKKR
jgi:thiol:disulfide interchange protein DsbC